MPDPTTADRAATPGPARRRARRRAGERGQVVVIFAGAMLVLIALCAVVVDVAWYWTVNLRMQRAADAAALAGVVWLPGSPSGAYAAARAEAAKNGFAAGTGGATITPVQDPTNLRRLSVTINAPVGTFFARAIGINSWPAARSAKADFVLPVPMGSPQNYYGVGFYEGRIPTTSTTHAAGTSGCGTASWSDACAGKVASGAPGGQWTTSSGSMQGSVQSNDNTYARETSNGHSQAWSGFGLLSGGSAIPDPAGNQTLTITGLEVRLSDAFLSASCSGSTIGVDMSWDGGSHWTSVRTTSALGTSTTSGDYRLGSATDPTVWGNHPWTRNNFNDTNFQVRLVANKGCGTSSTSLNVDMLEIRVIWDLATTTTTWTTETLDVPDPGTADALAPQGFWGAIFTSGGWRENGDKYGPSFIGNGTGFSSGSASPTYNAAGYDYTIELPGGSGQVQLFDPMFCATGDNGHGGSLGAGDHWTSPDRIAPVSITYRLYNTKETLLDTSDDGAPVATLTYDPGSATMGDMSGAFGTPQNSTHVARQDCSGNAAHSRWVAMATGLGAATYRLNVNTSLDSDNLNVGAENLFSIWVKSAGTARVYGGGEMAAYTNLDTGQQKFYFAQIERVHAGKTMEIHLFDPGETNGNAYLRLLSPDGNTYHYQRFNWTSDDGRSGSNTDVIQTSNGSALFNNREITITVQLPTTYGEHGLNPSGDITDEDGWWLIEYELENGNDTTTWSVDIKGNPVHLVLP